MRKFLYKYVITRFYHVLFGINNILQELDLTDKKCLCVAPHPDDESIGMGGTLAKYPSSFDVICLTDGSRAGTTLSKQELIKTRAIEFVTAMKLANIKMYKMINMPDKEMIVNSTENLIDISQYDYIFIPNILDQHRDHKSVSPYINFILKNKNHKKDVKICFYEVWSSLALPNYFVDISKKIDIKKQMINSHKSQVEEYDYSNKILCLNSYRGLAVKRDYVESYMVTDIKLFRKIVKACGIIS